jgi:hypothetical protein
MLPLADGLRAARAQQVSVRAGVSVSMHVTAVTMRDVVRHCVPSMAGSLPFPIVSISTQLE